MSSAIASTDAESPTVLITGSNRGIGLEFVRQYAERGWQVIATCRNPEAANDLQAIAAEYDKVRLEPLDVTDHDGVDALAKKYANSTIDVLLNNAALLGSPGRSGAGQYGFRFICAHSCRKYDGYAEGHRSLQTACRGKRSEKNNNIGKRCRLD
jgi:NAD(P)-dependent dehydrogenase (short-subunit alcohol dehydrogenase family)